MTGTPFVTRDVPGNYIDEGENSGLPGTKDLWKFSASKARNVVKSHLGRGSKWLSNSSHRLEKPGPPDDSRSRRKAKHHDLASIGVKGIEKDVEKDGGPPSPHGGGSILSSLLNLYRRADTPTSTLLSQRSSIDGESSAINTPWSNPEPSPRRRNQFRHKQPEQDEHRTFYRIFLSSEFLKRSYQRRYVEGFFLTNGHSFLY